jgi:hypothetical protein
MLQHVPREGWVVKRFESRAGKCLVCGLQCPEKTSPASKGWDWFTGYLPRTAHFCPKHKGNELRNRLFGIGEVPPEKWTKEERNFVEALENQK